MRSTGTMLTFVILVTFSYLNLIQHADSAVVPIAPATTPTAPSTTFPQTATAGTFNQVPSNVLDASTRLVNVVQDLIHSYLRQKKTSIATNLGLISNMLSNSTQSGGLKPGQGQNPATQSPVQSLVPQSAPPSTAGQTQPAPVQTAQPPAQQPTPASVSPSS